jgi:glutathione S-transferase
VEAEKRFHETLGFLDAMLDGHNYAAGDCLTIADCCLMATTASVDVSPVLLNVSPSLI